MKQHVPSQNTILLVKHIVMIIDATIRELTIDLSNSGTNKIQIILEICDQLNVFKRECLIHKYHATRNINVKCDEFESIQVRIDSYIGKKMHQVESMNIE